MNQLSNINNVVLRKTTSGFSNLLQKFTLFIFLFIFHCNSFCQTVALNKLKDVVKNGICIIESEKCMQKQVKYIKACEKLGDYYFKVKKFKTALSYYMKVADLDIYTDGELQYDEPIMLRNTVSEKAGNIYFYGLGVKEDWQLALALHDRTPNNHSKKIKDKYSKLYFGDNDYYYVNNENYLNDSIKIFGINPFYINDTNMTVQLSKDLMYVATKMKKDSTLRCKIEVTYGLLSLNIVNQSYLNRLLDYLTIYLNEKGNEKFIAEISIIEDGIVHKSFNLPKLSVRLTN